MENEIPPVNRVDEIHEKIVSGSREKRVKFARKTCQICNDDASGMRQIYDKKIPSDKIRN